jgi:hypothetical protein
MPILKNAKTVYVDENPWHSPDGKVTIWTIKLEHEGTRDTFSTMSSALAKEGFNGDVEIYTNDKGKTYARQAPKEEQEPAPGAPAQKRDWQPRDDDGIRAQWAIRTAVQMYSNWNKERPEYDDVEAAAKKFFAMVDRVKHVEQPKMIDANMSADDIRDIVVPFDENEPINLNDIPF